MVMTWGLSTTLSVPHYIQLDKPNEQFIAMIWVRLNMVFMINKRKPFEKRDFGMPNFQVEAHVMEGFRP